MALSKEWFEYHLTQNGWIEGSSHIDPGKTIEVAAPQNRVLTIRGMKHFHMFVLKPTAVLT